MRIIKHILYFLPLNLLLTTNAQQKIKEQVKTPLNTSEQNFIEKNYFNENQNITNSQYFNNHIVYERKWEYNLTGKVNLEWDIRYSDDKDTPISYIAITYNYINDSLISEKKSLFCSKFKIDETCKVNFIEKYIYDVNGNLIQKNFFNKKKAKHIFYYPNKRLKIKEKYYDIEKNEDFFTSDLEFYNEQGKVYKKLTCLYKYDKCSLTNFFYKNNRIIKEKNTNSIILSTYNTQGKKILEETYIAKDIELKDCVDKNLFHRREHQYENGLLIKTIEQYRNTKKAMDDMLKSLGYPL